ncbi:hypothetical protein [Winogradskyella sp.]|uniref:hypothetical protein n=1 Tax=Winogradskyella sp. TaxID=1883156 RepID=UPI003F6AEFF8
MTKSSHLKDFLFPICILFLLSPVLNAQTKRIKRPKSKVGVSSVDNFVRESFDLYDKVYIYDGYAAAGTPLKDEDIDVLEEALDELTSLSESAPDILNDLDGVGVLKQGKATLQINRAKKALTYSIKTAKELLLGQRERDQEKEEEDAETREKSTDERDDDSDESESNDTASSQDEPINVSNGLEVYSKYDFVPGDKLIFYDDYKNDFIGDFPGKWNTNGSGEVVTLNKVDGRWFEFKQGYNTYVIPNLPRELPENYTIEFDLIVLGISENTSSGANFRN